MKNLIKDDRQSNGFEERMLNVILQVQPYVKHRLYTAETSGIIPRNMYKANEIIDDAILKLYETHENKNQNVLELKLKLFSLVSISLDKLYQKEAFHKDTLSTSQILDQELEQLDEIFEADLDNDLLMNEELDDISYHQARGKKSNFLYADAEKNIINMLEIHDPREDLNEEKRIALNRIYNWLPFETSNILNLFIFGKLNYEEIAAVKNLKVSEVKKRIRTVSKNLRKNLN